LQEDVWRIVEVIDAIVYADARTGKNLPNTQTLHNELNTLEEARRPRQIRTLRDTHHLFACFERFWAGFGRLEAFATNYRIRSTCRRRSLIRSMSGRIGIGHETVQRGNEANLQRQ
jgi:hypothetical protein